jgi:hypothetical protein
MQFDQLKIWKFHNQLVQFWSIESGIINKNISNSFLLSYFKIVNQCNTEPMLT